MSGMSVIDQQEALKRLEAYSESLLDEDDYKRRKRKANRKQQQKQQQQQEKFNTTRDATANKGKSELKHLKKRKRKLEKGKNPENSNSGEEIKDDSVTVSGKGSHLEQLNKALGLQEFKHEQSKKMENEILKGDKNGSADSGPEVVVFKSHKKKIKKEVEGSDVGLKYVPNDKDVDDGQPVFDMKKSRYDVHKFGIDGLRGQQKEQAKIELLIKLGAKPPKKKYLNYKEFQDVRKKEMEEERRKRIQDKKDGLKVKAPEHGKKRRRDKNDVIGPVDGQIGRYQNGVQIIRKHELKGIKPSSLKVKKSSATAAE